MELKVRIFDTTLRDGEQTPGVALTPDQKIAIAQKLDELGVDAIEAGFPIISDGERQAIKSITGAGFHAEICGLARTERKDIDAAAAVGLKYIHTFIATSEIHLQYKLKLTREQALAKAEDAARTERDFLKKVFKAVTEAGADRLDIPDTVGYSTPEYIAAITKDTID